MMFYEIYGESSLDSRIVNKRAVSLVLTVLLIFLLTQKVLAAHGAAKVSAYVTHGVFPKKSWERFIHKNNGNDYL